MAIVSGNIRITLDGKKTFHETESSINISLDFKERATKDTDGTEVSPGVLSFEGSGSGLMTGALPDGVTDAMAFADLFDAMLAKSPLDFEFIADETGTTYYKGIAYLSSLESSGTVNEDATYSYSLRGSGSLEKAVVA